MENTNTIEQIMKENAELKAQMRKLEAKANTKKQFEKLSAVKSENAETSQKWLSEDNKEVSKDGWLIKAIRENRIEYADDGSITINKVDGAICSYGVQLWEVKETKIQKGKTTIYDPYKKVALQKIYG